MKFIVFVEGFTEQKVVGPFLKRWLDPRVTRRPGIKPVRFDGWREMEKDMAKKAKMYLQAPSHKDVLGVVALLDLYGPTFYPGHLRTSEERLGWARKHFEEEVGDPRFRMFFAVHELEAWLLSDPSIFPRGVGSELSSMAQMPETIDFDEPPGKLLARLYRDKTKRTYKKVVHGGSLFARLDPNVAYEKCPELRRMLDKMLQMAHSAGL